MLAFNFITNKEYAGSNALLQGNGDYPAFASFNQIRDNGYSVNKGAKSVSIFCGYRYSDKDDKAKSVPVWGRVFDIVDTNALDDPVMVDFLANTARIPSDLQINHELIGALNDGAKGIERVKQAYKDIDFIKELDKVASALTI